MSDGWQEVTLGDVAEVNPEATSTWPLSKHFRYVDLSSVSSDVGINEPALASYSLDTAPGRARCRRRLKTEHLTPVKNCAIHQLAQ